MWRSRARHQRHIKIGTACTIYFLGSAGAMVPQGTLEMFLSSLQHNLRYKWLISDGVSKMHALLLKKQPYGADNHVKKIDCVA